MLTALMTREEPLAKEVPPMPGSRAERYAQLLCPELHPIEQTAPSTGSTPAPQTHPDLGRRMQSLEEEVAALRQALQRLASSLGEPDPFAASPPSPRTEIV